MTLLTVKQAAQALNLSQSTVRALCGRRKLRHERHGVGRGKVLIPEDAVEEYRASVTVRAGAATPPPARPPVTLRHLRLRGG
jgi:excisionase family DNA binding protein